MSKHKKSKYNKLVSPSGKHIRLYTDCNKKLEMPRGEESITEISNHIEKHIGKIAKVFHEVVSDTVHIDIYHVEPTLERPFHTLITSGMSNLCMKIPEEADSPSYMELIATLPKNWKVDEKSFEDEIWCWPVRTLLFLARFPHKNNSWLGWGHSIPNDYPPKPFAKNTDFNCILILNPITVHRDFLELKINDNKVIHFFSLVPIYGEEMKLSLTIGTDVLLEKFDEYFVSDVIDIRRKNVAV